MVDLFAVGLLAVLTEYLLPPVRALQSRGLAVACPRDRARPRGAGFVASGWTLAGSHHRRDPSHLLAVRRMGVLARPVRHHQLGRQLFRRGLCSRGAAAGLDRPYPQPAIAAAGPGRGRRSWALHLCPCALRLAVGGPAVRPFWRALFRYPTQHDDEVDRPRASRSPF